MVAMPLVVCQDAQSAIHSAKNALRDAYKAVLLGESAGTNVESLMITLNEAADLLSKVELADAAKDYGAANNYASQSLSKLNGLTVEAATLTQSTQSSASQA
jgi:hypothetical protein